MIRFTVGGGRQCAEGIATLAALAAIDTEQIQVLHDDGCPCPDGFPLEHCTCTQVEISLPEAKVKMEHRAR
jgi:hypothetical protein